MLRLVGAYLAVFAYLAPDYRHARDEHSLIVTSIRQMTGDLDATGLSPIRATFRAYRLHLSELDPIALARKTSEDAVYGARNRATRLWHVVRLGTAIGVIVLTSSAILYRPGGGEAAFEFGRPDPTAAGQSGGTRGEGAGLREALYRSTGVCLDRSVSAADLTDDLVQNGSPGADCSDLD